jgi:hypothetical protein
MLFRERSGGAAPTARSFSATSPTNVGRANLEHLQCKERHHHAPARYPNKGSGDRITRKKRINDGRASGIPKCHGIPIPNSEHSNFCCDVFVSFFWQHFAIFRKKAIEIM